MKHAARHDDNWPRPLRLMRTFLAWLVILAIAGVVTVAVLVPRLGGATPYTILTGSMRPDMPPGTLAVVKPISVDNIAVGDVVTYQLNSGEPTVVTHRVTAMGTTVKGKLTFTTQGDANDVADAKQVRPVQIKGKLWYSVPYLGYVNNAITGNERRVTMIVVVSGLLLYASYMFAGAFHGRTRRFAS